MKTLLGSIFPQFLHVRVGRKFWLSISNSRYLQPPMLAHRYIMGEKKIETEKLMCSCVASQLVHLERHNLDSLTF